MAKYLAIFLAFCIFVGIMMYGALYWKFQKEGRWMITSDGGKYLNQSLHNWQGTTTPFIYRWAMPELVRQVALIFKAKEPFYPFIALNLLFIAGFYTVLMKIMADLGIMFKWQLVGILSLMAYWPAYWFSNLFLVEGPAMFFMSLAILALIHRRAFWFVIAVCIGIQFKEYCLFLAPVWWWVDET